MLVVLVVLAYGWFSVRVVVSIFHSLDLTGGVGWMFTFLALAHMLDATQWMGWGGVGGMLTFLEKTAVAYLRKKTPEKSVAAKWRHKVLRNASFKQKQQDTHSISKPSDNMLTSGSIAFTIEILLRIFPQMEIA